MIVRAASADALVHVPRGDGRDRGRRPRSLPPISRSAPAGAPSLCTRPMEIARGQARERGGSAPRAYGT